MAMFLVCLKLGVVLSLGHLGAIIAFSMAQGGPWICLLKPVQPRPVQMCTANFAE